MSNAQPGTFADPAEVADFIVDEFAAENKGVAKVIPAERIEQRLDDVVAASDAFDDAEFEALHADVKDAVLEQGVVIA